MLTFEYFNAIKLICIIQSICIIIIILYTLQEVKDTLDKEELIQIILDCYHVNQVYYYYCTSINAITNQSLYTRTHLLA